MEEIDKILIKLSYKMKKRAIKELKKKYKNFPNMIKYLNTQEKKLPTNY